jgi:hypothetical protein
MIDPRAALHDLIFGSASLGSVLAVVLSWDRNRSIFLAIVHAFFSWIYVIWWAITRHSRPPMY